MGGDDGCLFKIEAGLRHGRSVTLGPKPTKEAFLICYLSGRHGDAPGPPQRLVDLHHHTAPGPHLGKYVELIRSS